MNGATFTAPTLLEELDGDWKLYGLEFPAAQANGSTLLEIHQNGAGSGDFYLDGIQVEQKDGYYTTYCDGTQVGCEWNGAEHASTSTRSAASRAGGRVYDLEDDYGLKISGMSGSGTAPQELFVDSYSQLPGGELNTIKTNSRVITLTGIITGTSVTNFHAVKQALKSLLAKDAVPKDQNGYQPVRLRYVGATVHKEIAVHYEGGLEGEISADKPCAWEDVAVRFIAPNPYWYEIGESAALLDTNDSATFRVVAGRLRSTGQWSALGPPGAGGTYTIVYSIVEDSTYLYVAGNFLNFDGIANADRVVRYSKQTGTWSALGTGMNADTFALAIGPDGRLYAGGAFTTAGGTAANYIAVWDGSSWAALGTGLNSDVHSLVFGSDGTLYVGGGFTTAGGGAANYIASWNGSAWSALGTGMGGSVDNSVYSLAFGGGLLYASGGFTTSGGTTTNYIASWNGTAWAALNNGGNVASTGHHALAYNDRTGILYAGVRTNETNDYLSVWNGVAWSDINAGLSNVVQAITIGPDNMLYVGGNFSSIGGLSLADRIARYNGYAWSMLDIDLPGSPAVYTIFTGKADPVVPQKYNIYIGFTTTGTGNFAGTATPSNGGKTPAFPKAIFTRAGGTTATVQTLRNERNGQEILFNYSLLDGETLTIDLTQTKKSISSSFFGSRQDAVLKNSDFGNWHLLPGDNQITSFVSTAGSPTITAYLLYKDQYDSQD